MLIVIALLVVIPATAFVYKVVVLDYNISSILPRALYSVTLRMRFDGDNRRVRVSTFAPLDGPRQEISGQSQTSDPAFYHSEDRTGLGAKLVWIGAPIPNQTELRYEFSASVSAVKYELEPELRVPESYPKSVRGFLLPTENIQVDHDDVTGLLERLGADRGALVERLTAIYDHTSELGSRPFKGTTDALTALRLGEASCNGKSRLFVALARATGIPARLVGGLVLEVGTKRTSHQWVETYIGGHWVPFDPTNDHFAALPGNYLALYRGDEALFQHTADINFDYAFTISKRMVPSSEARSSFKAFNVWDLFARLNLPFSLLQTVLMLPVGALVVVLFRNVIGVPTFGTFLPALIAASTAATGILWGIVSVLTVTVAVVLARMLLQRLRLLHSPTLAILLTVVVVSMLGTSLFADHMQLNELARVSYFPIAVMAIAAERLYLAFVEQGPKSALQQLSGTLLVVLSCAVVMNSLALQVLVSGFPEVLLLVVAANIYLGRWVGVRVIEYWRFRRLLRAAPREGTRA